MGPLLNVLRLFCIYFILSIQYSFYEASPLYGPNVTEAPPETEKKLPFIVSLSDKSLFKRCNTPDYNYATELAHFCGGSLITNEHVLTAAHCLSHRKRFDEVIVKIGSRDIGVEVDVHEISWWLTYSQHNNITLVNNAGTDVADDVYDIAIIKLTKSVKKVQLPTISYITNKDLLNKRAVIVGWGLTEKNKMPRYMRIGRTTIDMNCEHHSYGVTVEDFNEIFFCTQASMARVAKGDSGGPVLYGKKNPTYPKNIIGVVAEVNEKNNVHMSVHFFRKFIEAVTQL